MWLAARSTDVGGTYLSAACLRHASLTAVLPAFASHHCSLCLGQGVGADLLRAVLPSSEMERRDLSGHDSHTFPTVSYQATHHAHSLATPHAQSLASHPQQKGRQGGLQGG